MKNGNMFETADELFSKFSKYFSSIGKLTLDEYYGGVCDYIEGVIEKISKIENLKCFGGKCTFYGRKKEGSVFLFSSGDDKEYVISEVSLYFQGKDKQWVNKKTSGSFPIDRLDLNDEETQEFVKKISEGKKVEQPIDAPNR